MPTVFTSQIKILKQKGKVATDHRRKRELQQKNAEDKDITINLCSKSSSKKKVHSDRPQKTISDNLTLTLTATRERRNKQNPKLVEGKKAYRSEQK